MKKTLRILVVSVVSVLTLVVLAFGALTGYYRIHFPVNTWINGVYCTGKTVDEVNTELVKNNEASVVKITDANRAYWEIDMREAGIVPDYRISLQKNLQTNSKVFWTKWFHKTTDLSVQADSYSYEEDRLKQYLEQLKPVRRELDKKSGVEIRRVNGVYMLYDGNAERLDTDLLYEALVVALKQGNDEIFADELAVYRDLPDTEADSSVRQLWQKLNQFADCRLMYDMGGEQIFITPQMAVSFLKKNVSELESIDGTVEKVEFFLDEQGDFIVDETAVSAWVDIYLGAYNTKGTSREFSATRGEVVSVPYVEYGTQIDMEAEKAYLADALTRKRTDVEVRVPTYEKQGFVRGLDDIGGTYIEIDMTVQKMYYYKDGAILLETDVVTGDVRDRMETPVGINYVYNKQRNRTLRGKGYTAYVKYWMPVVGAVGIHDASWRSKFGGEIYKKDGSHGCINTPSAIMDDFYDVVEIGTPVIMFY